MVIDASSTDGTVEYIQNIKNIKLVTQKSSGLTGAMIEAINLVKQTMLLNSAQIITVPLRSSQI